MKGEYTEKIHAKRLIKVLERKNTYESCPAAIGYSEKISVSRSWPDSKVHPCKICLEFIGIYNGTYTCPCIFFEKDEAVKQSWLALETKGYI